MVGISWHVSGQEKSPGALILKGFLIFPGLLGTLLERPDGGRRRIEKPSAGRAPPRFGQFGHGRVLQKFLRLGRRWHLRIDL
jgi:hypothetical protein